MRSRKYLRQLLTNQKAVDKLRRDRHLLQSAQVMGRLMTISAGVTGATNARCINMWDGLIRSGDVERVASVVLDDGEFAAEMRNTSPLTVLLNEQERAAAVRGGSKSVLSVSAD